MTLFSTDVFLAMVSGHLFFIVTVPQLSFGIIFSSDLKIGLVFYGPLTPRGPLALKWPLASKWPINP